MNTLERQWFAITDHGALLVLGDCGDSDAALEVAKEMSEEILTVIDSNTAANWRHTIEKQFSNCVPEHRKPNVFKRAKAKLATVPYPVVKMKRKQSLNKPA